MSKDLLKGYSSAEARWARLGSYYAMFPTEFALDVIDTYSEPGDRILDPFAGRGTSIYAGAVLDRPSTGIEINPVGWIFAQTKLNPADKALVTNRLQAIYDRRYFYNRGIEKMPKFFRMCFCDEVLKFLLFARNNLDWLNDNTDRTLMSIILASLHDNLGDGLSNQMRRTKSMGMEYSIKWWNENGFSLAPEVNPLSMLLKKIEWRYYKGRPNFKGSKVLFGDSTQILNLFEQEEKYSLLFTSPPYQGVTDYHADQWLRLWMLSGKHGIKTNEIPNKNRGRFVNKNNYEILLDTVFEKSSYLMDADCTVYVRTDKRDFTLETTHKILKLHFPKHKISVIEKPLSEGKITQTQLFGDKSLKPGEVDIILTR